MKFSLFFWEIKTIDFCESLVWYFILRGGEIVGEIGVKFLTKNSVEKNSVVIYTIDGWWQVAGWQGVTRCIFHLLRRD